jgi:hypothetical protein
MKILFKFLEFRVIGFKSEGFGFSINRKQQSLPVVDLIVARCPLFGLSLSKWN